MSLSLFACFGKAPLLSARRGWERLAALSLCVALPGLALGQGSYSTNGVEYAIAGALPGDQVHPQLGLQPSGGYLVWEDNLTDGYGWGVSALRLDSGFSGVLAPFRVNVTGVGDQNNPQVAMLNNGGAGFVWQSGPQGYQHIFARFISLSNLWQTGEIMVNTVTNAYQMTPVIATLTNGNVAVAWSSMNQAGSNSLQDVYAQILSPSGTKIGGEIPVNQFISYNQRSPAIAALADGRFVVVWVSEQQRVLATAPTSLNPVTYGSVSVDIFARIFSATGVAATPELLVNTSSSLCSSPKVAAAADGTFMVVWAEQDRQHGVNGIDIIGRTFSAAGTGGTVRTINTTIFGDQYLPTISADNSDYLVAWTSLGQDGSWEGVFAQFLHYDGTADGNEFQVNTAFVSHQIHPAVASDKAGRFVAVWTSFIGGVNSYDLRAQRYVNSAVPLSQMAAPFVYTPFTFAPVGTNSVYQPQLQISWPFQTGLPVDHYELFVDGAVNPTVTLTTNVWLMTAANGLTTNSTHSFQVGYVINTGRHSPPSPAAIGTTWSGQSWGGIPWEWMTYYYGTLNVTFDGQGIHYNWPDATAQVTHGGPTLLQIFLTGASPLNSSTWLRTSLARTPQGNFLSWNPQPGLIYQVQTSSNLLSWANVGSPRFAAGNVDYLYVGGGNVSYYRILRLR